MPSSLPRWNHGRPVVSAAATSPSPFPRRVGFHDCRFRGLRNVHSRYGPGASLSGGYRPWSSKALDRWLPRDRLRLLPGGQPPSRMGLAPMGSTPPFTAHAGDDSPPRYRGFPSARGFPTCARLTTISRGTIVPRSPGRGSGKYPNVLRTHLALNGKGFCRTKNRKASRVRKRASDYPALGMEAPPPPKLGHRDPG